MLIEVVLGFGVETCELVIVICFVEKGGFCFLQGDFVNRRDLNRLKVNGTEEFLAGILLVKVDTR